jgi:DNA-binding beta-propeller fold protein YncE
VKPPRQVTLSGDGQRVLALAEGASRVQVWDAATGEPVQSIGGNWGGREHASLSADGRLLAVMVPDSSRVVSVPTGVVADPLGGLWVAVRDRPFANPVYVPAQRPLVPGLVMPGRRPPGVLGGLGGIGGIGRGYPVLGYRNSVLDILNLSGMGPYGGGYSLMPGVPGFGGVGFGPRYTNPLGLPLGGYGPRYLDSLGLAYGGYHPMGLGGFGHFEPHMSLLGLGSSRLTTLDYVLGIGQPGMGYGSGFGLRTSMVPITERVQQQIRGFLAVRDTVARREPLRVAEGTDRAAFSPDGTLVAVAVGGAVSVRKVATGEVAHTLGSHPGQVRALAFAPDGKTLASAGEDGMIQLWEVASGRAAALAVRPGGLAGEWVAGPTGLLLQSADRPGDELRAGDRVVAILGEGGKEVATAGMSAAEFLRRTAGPVGTSVEVRVVRGKDGAAARPVARQPLPRVGVGQLAFSPDGRWLVAVTDLGTVACWDVGARGEVFALYGEQRAVAFSPDGQRLVVAGAGGLAVVRPDTGQRLCALPGFGGQARALAFRADGSLVAAVTESAGLAVRVWKRE